MERKKYLEEEEEEGKKTPLCICKSWWKCVFWILFFLYFTLASIFKKNNYASKLKGTVFSLHLSKTTH